jgi:DNA mismatch endonuclease (patch repair protein)
MADVHSKEMRSYNMSRIKSKNTNPEILVRKFLYARGMRYKLHDKRLPGSPDMVFPKYKTVVFIHGCFWHGHDNCRYYTVPKTRTEWWLNKINKNIERDHRNTELLKKKGWAVVTVWECDLKIDKREKTLQKLLNKVKNI